MKIAICVPTRDVVHVGFAKCLANLTASLAVDNIDYELLFNLGSVIPQQRNTLVDHALTINATHLLWLDSDMHFPHQTVQQFLEHNKDIVAATYSTRVKPQRSVAFLDQNNLDLRLTNKTGLHKVFAVGMGCMLVTRRVFENIPKPWFQYIWNEDTKDLSGEDIYFCKQANDTGFEVWIDSDVSQRVAHYGTKAYLISETNDSI
jgi:Anp1